MKNLVLLTILALSTNALACSEKVIDEKVATFLSLKIKDILNERFYGTDGKAPKGLSEMLAFCNSTEMNGVEEIYKDKMIFKAQAKKGKCDLEDLGEHEGLIGDVAPLVFGYCNIQDPQESQRCNFKNESGCKAAEGAYEKKIRALIKSPNALAMGGRGLCRKIVTIWDQSHQEALGHLEMCRLDQEDKAAKSKAVDKRNLPQSSNVSPATETIIPAASSARGQ